MAPNDQDLRDRIRDPKESLDTELKPWIDPSAPDGIAKIAKACIALRNNNGGCLIIGFNDDSTPCVVDVPTDVRAAFHTDTIQGIVSKYSSKQFEVRVDFVERDGVQYPILSVPSGVETPVAARADLQNPLDPTKPLIRCDTVYVRTLNSNNIVSTSPARHSDLERLTKICFDNREADIGSFIRRHLPNLDLEKLAFFSGASKPEPTATESAVGFLDIGRSRFEAAMAKRQLVIPDVGVREASVVIDGDFPVQSANTDFIQLLQASKPTHSGWTPWMDTRGASERRDAAYTFEGGWEALLVELDPSSFFGPHLDFWRMEPVGKFYHLRGLEDDLAHSQTRHPQPRTQLDFLLQVSRVAEIISIGMSFARSLGCNERETSIAYAFRWSGLANRTLTSWVESDRNFYSRGSSEQNAITTDIVVPLETVQSGLTPFVEHVVAPVFELFGGMKFQSSVIDGIVKTTLGRRF